ncbi:MAG TPA: histidine phosphatase family protein [Micromonosporaceae bacterium]|nr:histidine phosphatase family protein [Micromonosporaceae bacterium]
MGEMVLIRHGQTEWSATGRHTSYTDMDLTEEGERQATALGKALTGQAFTAVVTSPRTRALRTAVLAGLDVSTVDEDLAEWHYGDYEGMTTPQIRQGRPGWTLWTDGCPGGESPEQVGARVDRLLARVAAQLGAGNVAMVGHGHLLRVVGARWVGLPPSAGGLLRLDTGTLSRLGREHDRQVVLSWNCPV